MGSILGIWILSSVWSDARADRINYSELVNLAERDMLRSTRAVPLILTGSRLTGRYFDTASQTERNFVGIIPPGSQHSVADILVAQGFIVKVGDGDQRSWTHFVLTSGFPLLLLAGVLFIFVYRRSRGGGGGLLSLGKSSARLWTKGCEVTFENVAGADEAKEELQEIVEFLEDPRRFSRLGGRIPRGVLLMGPPGTGKTLLARAVAGEAGVPFFSISASEFVEIFVGVGASRVRDLFKTGRRHAPSIVFIDEIDSIGRRRGAGLGGGHDEREQALNQLLSEMDGFESSEGVIVVGATNRPDILDPALLRAGRFDRHVVVGLPDVRAREGILRVHLRGIPLSDDVEIPLLARSTSGFSGAGLENLVNEAALRSARLDREKVTMADFLEEKDKRMMGRERRSLTLSTRDRTAAAYREAGYTMVAWLLPDTDPVLKVTIVPRTNDLGTTIQVPSEDRHTSTVGYLESTVAILMARRCAEEIFLGSVTSAVADDLSKATELARQMVCEWGMDEEIGPLSLGGHEENVFLGREVSRHRQYGEATSTRIDLAVRRVVLEGYRKARKILEDWQSTVVRLANALLETETLDWNQLQTLIEPVSHFELGHISHARGQADRSPNRPPLETWTRLPAISTGPPKEIEHLGSPHQRS
ncbi:MAG: ATP-dependent zinc metalloprotease FtsH [Acidobacteriota bacterium]|nr:MAG: ATP-dependent zinc metalloprotease FtsH [Acidobacteriota bacterium]